MTFLQAAAIGLIALIISPGFFFYFDVTPKIVLLLAGTVAALLWAAVDRGPVSRSRAMACFSGLLLLNLLSLFLSSALSPNPGLSFFGTNWRRFGTVVQAALMLFVWLLARSIAGRPDRARIILRAFAVTGVLTGAYGIAQYLGWDPFLPAAAYHIGEGIWTIVRPPGTLGYVSYFATWLVVTLFLSLSMAGFETDPRWRGLGYSAAAISATAMLMTGTRAAMLGLAAGGAYWLYAQGFRISRRMAAAAALILLAGTAFYFSPAGWNLRSRARWFREDSSGGARTVLWRDSIAMASHRPLAGYGPEVFNAEFPKYKSRELAQAYPDFQQESPHNMFLDALVAQGVPGFLLLTGISAVALWAAAGLKGAGGLLGCALIAGLVSQQFTAFTMPSALIFFVTAALLAGLRSEPESPPRGPAFAILAVVASAALLYCAVRYTVADRALAQANHALETGDPIAAAAHYKDSERWRFPGNSADLWYSRAMIGLAQKARNPVIRAQALAQAGAAAVRAPFTAEDPANACYSLAQWYAAQNDAPNTEKSLRCAIAASPNWFKPHWVLAQVLTAEARTAEARTEAALAADLDGGKHAEVARTLQDMSAPLHGQDRVSH